MDKNHILENLAEIAAALDDQNMTREADAVTQVMTRVAQQASNPFAPMDLRQQPQSYLGAPQVFAPQQPQSIQDILRPYPPQQPQSIQDILQPYAPQQPQVPQAVSQEDALMKRYLGWAFHAISVKKVSVANTRAALQQHLQASKQTPEFIQKTLLAFDSQIANQKALQGK